MTTTGSTLSPGDSSVYSPVVVWLAKCPIAHQPLASAAMASDMGPIRFVSTLSSQSCYPADNAKVPQSQIFMNPLTQHGA